MKQWLKRPRGRIPKATKEWLKVNEPDCSWEIAVCDCGRWFHHMDHLAPYHFEMSVCKKCGPLYKQKPTT